MRPANIMGAHLVILSCWHRTFQFHWLWGITSCDCLRNKFQPRHWTSIWVVLLDMKARTPMLIEAPIPEHNDRKKISSTLQSSPPCPSFPWTLTADIGVSAFQIHVAGSSIKGGRKNTDLRWSTREQGLERQSLSEVYTNRSNCKEINVHILNLYW